MRRGIRKGLYRLVHAVLPDGFRVRLRRLIRGAEHDARREAQRAARLREKELRIELKRKASAARAARAERSARGTRARPRRP